MLLSQCILEGENMFSLTIMTYLHQTFLFDNVAVAQWSVWLLLTPEDPGFGSSLFIKHLLTFNFIKKMKKKDAGKGLFEKPSYKI